MNVLSTREANYPGKNGRVKVRITLGWSESQKLPTFAAEFYDTEAKPHSERIYPYEVHKGDQLVAKDGALLDVIGVFQMAKDNGKVVIEFKAYGPLSAGSVELSKRRKVTVMRGGPAWKTFSTGTGTRSSSVREWAAGWLKNVAEESDRPHLLEWVEQTLARVGFSEEVDEEQRKGRRLEAETNLGIFAEAARRAVEWTRSAITNRQRGEGPREVAVVEAKYEMGKTLAAAEKVAGIEEKIPIAELRAWAAQIRHLAERGDAASLQLLGLPRGYRLLVENTGSRRPDDRERRASMADDPGDRVEPIKRVDNPHGKPGDGSVYKFINKAGDELEGFVQGGHGHLLIGRDGLRRLEEAQAFAAAGKRLRIAEPVKGHVLLYPAKTDWSKPFTERPTLNVPLVGKRIFLTADEIHGTAGFTVIEFWGTGDPAFGGKADDRPLVADRTRDRYEFRRAGRYTADDVAVFATEAAARAAADKAEKRPGGRVSILARKPATTTAKELTSEEGARAFIRRRMEAYRKDGVSRREAVRIAFSDARREGFTAVPAERKTMETIYKGDRARFTGKTERQHGGLFHELVVLEGHEKGAKKWTQKGPT